MQLISHITIEGDERRGGGGWFRGQQMKEVEESKARSWADLRGWIRGKQRDTYFFYVVETGELIRSISGARRCSVGNKITTGGSAVSAPVPVASEKGPCSDAPKARYLRCGKTTDRFT